MKDTFYKHFILTRFNLPLWRKFNSNGDNLAQADDYLNRRFEIFEKYCLPSIRNQINQNFVWLVLFDVNTSEKYKQRLSVLSSKYENLVPCYLNIEEYKNFPHSLIEQYNDYARILVNPFFEKIEYEEKIQRLITPLFLRAVFKKYVSDETEYIITTRIDNDDAFHYQMVEDIQRRFKQAPKECIFNYLHGYQYDLNNQIGQLYFYPNNHFTTLVEKYTDGIQTVFYWDHRFIDKFKEIVNIKTEPMWIELLHDGNVGNRFSIDYRNRIKFTGIRLEDYSYPEGFSRIGLMNTLQFICKKKFIKTWLGSLRYYYKHKCESVFGFHTDATYES